MSALEPVSFLKGRQHAPRIGARYVPGKHSERHWSGEEDAILREKYPAGGVAAAAPALPKRSKAAIQGRAHKLGLACPQTFAKALQIRATLELDQQIRDGYLAAVGRGDVNALADRMNLPRWWLSARARTLGLVATRKKEPAWSAAEKALLKTVPLHNGARCVEIFKSHGFTRTEMAIRVMSKRMGLLVRDTRQTLTGTTVAEILGLDNKTTTGWCVTGVLPATRRGSKRLPQQGGDIWDIDPEVLRRWIVDNIASIDIRKVEKVAFVDLLTGGKYRDQTGAGVVS